MNPSRIQAVKYSPGKNVTCRLLFIYVLFLIPIAGVTAQEVSVLPQFFAANPLVKRDPVFERIHKYLNESVENTTLGLTENLSGKLNKVKTSLDSLSLKVAVTGGPAKEIIVTYNFFNTSNKVYKKDLKDFLTNKQTLVDSLTHEFVNKALLKYPISNNRLAETPIGSLNKLILFIVSSSLTNKEVNLAEFNDLDDAEFRNTVTRNLQDFLISVLQPLNDRTSKEQLTTDVTIAFNTLIETIRSRFIQMIYQLEDTIEQTKKNISDKAIAANTGIGISEEEGNLGGGLIATIKTTNSTESESFRATCFVSGVGEIGDSDTTSKVKQPFLVGANVEYRKFNHQFSFLLSYKYNKFDLNDKRWFWEAGLGYMGKTKEGVIIGASFFAQIIDRTITVLDEAQKPQSQKVESLFTGGVTVRGDSNTSPTIFLGVSNQSTVDDFGKDEWVPIIQLSYPIIFGQR